jgi:hypothetical protein
MKSRRMTAEERRKASGPAYRAAAAPAHRGAATVVRRSALRLPVLGSKKIASLSFEASFHSSVKEDLDANRIAGLRPRVVMARLAAVTRGRIAV